jgi:hypothetical protein
MSATEQIAVVDYAMADAHRRLEEAFRFAAPVWRRTNAFAVSRFP